MKVLCCLLVIILQNVQGNEQRWKRQIATNGTFSLAKQQTDVSLQLEPDAPWENFLIPAPTVIALLGQLMVISTKVDFSLADNPPIGGFKYIRQPSSFRACLVQVSNDGWHSFHNAHKNMDQIQLLMQQIPVHVKTSLKLILKASTNIMKQMLPIPLAHIKSISEKCIELSVETEKKFLDVMFLLGEILMATQSTQGNYESKLFVAEVELNVSKVQREQLDNIGDTLKKQQERLDGEVKKYQKAYEKALKDIPTGWKKIGQDIIRSVGNLVNALPSLMFNGFGMKIGSGSAGVESAGYNKIPSAKEPSGSAGVESAGINKIPSTKEPDFMASKTFGIMQTTFEQLGTIKDAMKQIFNKNQTFDDPSGMFQSYSITFRSFLDILGEAGGSASKLLERGINICDRVQTLFSNVLKQIPEAEKQTLIKQVEDLWNDVNKVVAAGAFSSAGMSIQVPGDGQGGQGGQGQEFTDVNANEKYKAYLTLENLKEANKRYDKMFDEILKYQEEMKKLMTRMAELNMKSINYKEIIELIKEAVLIMAKIREQWSKLVQFFTLVSVRADAALSKTLVPFIQYAEAAQNIITTSGVTQDDRNFLKDMFLSQAVDIQKISYFLYILSKTYVDVSSKYILDRLAGIAGLLATNSEDERKSLLTRLQKGSDVAQDNIKKLAQERRETYKKVIQERIDAVGTFVNQLGGPSENEIASAKIGIETIKKKADNPDNPFDFGF